MKILLAIPTFENILPEVFQAVYDLDKGGHEVDFKFVKGYDCAKARNVIAKKALEGNYDYVLMLDSDTIIPKDALVVMLEHPADVILGCCPRKNTKEKRTVLFPLKDNATGYFKPLYYENMTDERMELRGGGFACALISVSMLKKLKYPYFKYVVYENGDALSEDLYFCSEARKQGFKIWGEPRVKCGHLARYFQYE